MGYKALNADLDTILKIVDKVTDGYGDGLWLGPEFLVFADKPEILKVMLNSDKCLDKSRLYDAFKLEHSLALSAGNVWKRHRKILNPAFSVNILQQLVPTFDEKSKILVKNIKSIERNSLTVARLLQLVHSRHS